MTNDLMTTTDGWDDAAIEASQRVLRGTLISLQTGMDPRQRGGADREGHAARRDRHRGVVVAGWQADRDAAAPARATMPEREELGNTDESRGGGSGRAAEGPGRTPALSTDRSNDSGGFHLLDVQLGRPRGRGQSGRLHARMRSAHPDACRSWRSKRRQCRRGSGASPNPPSKSSAGRRRTASAGSPATTTAVACARDGRRPPVVTIRPARRRRRAGCH